VRLERSPNRASNRYTPAEKLSWGSYHSWILAVTSETLAPCKLVLLAR